MTTPDLYSQLPYTEILDNIDVGIALYDRSGNYLFVNTALINWRNIPRSEYLKMNVHDFLGVLDVCIFDLDAFMEMYGVETARQPSSVLQRVP